MSPLHRRSLGIAQTKRFGDVATAVSSVTPDSRNCPDGEAIFVIRPYNPEAQSRPDSVASLREDNAMTSISEFSPGKWHQITTNVSGLSATADVRVLHDGRVILLAPDDLGIADVLTITAAGDKEPILSLQCRPNNQDDWGLATAILEHLGVGLPRLAPATAPEPKLFRVVWEIDIDAGDPQEAAHKAHAIQRDPESTATVFRVRHPLSKEDVTIDLLEEAENTIAPSPH
jgi:hypothetical protein